MYPLGCHRQDPENPNDRDCSNSNFRIALFQLFALLVVLRVLRVVLARRTSPLDDEEDDDEEDDDGEENPDHNWHQKSIGILVRGVDGVLEEKTGFYRDVFSQFYVSQAQFCSMSYNCDRCPG